MHNFSIVFHVISFWKMFVNTLDQHMNELREKQKHMPQHIRHHGTDTNQISFNKVYVFLYQFLTNDWLCKEPQLLNLVGHENVQSSDFQILFPPFQNFVFKWRIIWFFKCCRSRNSFPHSWQANSFIPEWIFKCRIIFLFVWNCLPHSVHSNLCLVPPQNIVSENTTEILWGYFPYITYLSSLTLTK